MFNNIQLISNIINSTMIYIQTWFKIQNDLRFKHLSLTINDFLYDKKRSSIWQPHFRELVN